MGFSVSPEAWKKNKSFGPSDQLRWDPPESLCNQLCPEFQLCEDGPAKRIWEPLRSRAFEISQPNDFIQLGLEEKDNLVIGNKIHPLRVFPLYLLDISAIPPAGI